MLYISKWKAAAILLTAFDLSACSRFPTSSPRARSSAGRHGRSVTSCSASTCRAARISCSRSMPTTCARQKLAVAAGRRAQGPARGAHRPRQRARHPRQLGRGAHPRERPAAGARQAARAVAAARRASSARPAARSLDVENVGGGLVRLTVTEPAILERIRQVVDQSVQIIEQARQRSSAWSSRRSSARASTASWSRCRASAIRSSCSKILGKTAKLTFRLVDTSMTAEQALQGRPPPESEIVYGSKAENRQPYLLEKRVIVSGEELTDAQPGFDQRTSEPIVTFRFNSVRRAQVRAGDPGERRPAVCHRARRRGDFGPVIREPILGGQRADFRQLHGRIGQQSRHSAARRRAARQADRDRAARGRRRPRPGFDREGQARRPISAPPWSSSS